MMLGPLLTLFLASDPIVLAHADHSKASVPLFLTRHAGIAPAAGSGPDSLGTANASLDQFYVGAGKKPTTRACALDLDGDGGDEIALIRANVANGKSQLLIVRAPSALGEKKPTLLASTTNQDAALAAASGDVLAIGRFLRAGSSHDDLVLVHGALDGSQTLEIRTPPGGKKKTLGAPQLKLDVGNVAIEGEVIAAFGLPLDPAAGDELVVVHASASATSIQIFSVTGYASLTASPTSAAIELPSDTIDVAPSRVGAENAPGILLVRATAEGTRIETRPIAPTGQLGAASLDAKSPYSNLPLFAAFAVRVASPDSTGGGGGSDPPPPPPPSSEAWEIGVGLGSNTLALLKVKRDLSVEGLHFVDDSGASIDLEITWSGTDYFSFKITPSTFKLKLKPKTGPQIYSAYLNVTNPNAGGSGGFTTSGFQYNYGVGSGFLGTVLLPGIVGPQNIDWIGFRPAQ